MTSLSSLPFSCSTLRVKPTTKTPCQVPWSTKLLPDFAINQRWSHNLFSVSQKKTHSQPSNEKWSHKVSSSANYPSIHASISSNHWASSQQIVHRHTLQPMARKGFLPRQGSQSTSHSYWAMVPQFRTFGQHNYCWVDIISTKCIVGVFSGGRHWVSACIIAMVSNVLPLSCILHRLFFWASCAI